MAAASNPPYNSTTQSIETTGSTTINLTIFTGVEGGKSTGDE